jgi:prevent-host-death family protein
MITPQIVPISDLRIRHTEVLAMLEQGPVFLAQRSKAAAVLVSVGEWNVIAGQLKRLQQLELLAEAKRNKAGVEQGEATTISHDELKQLVLEKIAQGVPAHVGEKINDLDS